MRNQPPISFRPQQQQPQQNNQFNRNQFVNPQHNQQQNQHQNQQPQNDFYNLNINVNNTQRNTGGGPQPQAKSYMQDPRAGSNMDAKYIAHLKTLEDFLNKNDVKDLTGAKLVNKTLDKVNYDLSLEINYTIKGNGADVPIRLRIGPKFPNEKPKLFAAFSMKHPAIDSSTLEIDYSKYYPWNKNSTIKLVIMSSKEYFQNNPVSNNAIEKKMRELIKDIDLQEIQNVKKANIKNFYQQLTPSEKKSFQEENKRLELLKKMPEMKALTDKHEKLVRIAELLKEKVTENYQSYESRTHNFLCELNLFEELKQQVFAKYSASLLLQERFTKGQLLPVIEEQIRQIKNEDAPEKFKENLSTCNNEADTWNCMQRFLKENKESHEAQIRCDKLKENLN